jgi:acetyl esterase/lipase
MVLLRAGGADLMRPDIAAFAGKAKAAGEAPGLRHAPEMVWCHALLFQL